MPQVIQIKCDGPNKCVNEIDLKVVINEGRTIFYLSMNAPPPDIQPRYVLRCKHCTEGEVIITRQMIEENLNEDRKMPPEKDKPYESQHSKPLDNFWLDQGKKILEDSFPAIRGAANSLITALSLLQTIYVAILGFSCFLPDNLPTTLKFFFLAPFLFWLASLYFTLRVIMTDPKTLNLHAPDQIHEAIKSSLKSKQSCLNWAFGLLVAGLVFLSTLFIIRSTCLAS